jgi:hypothetical protein
MRERERERERERGEERLSNWNKLSLEVGRGRKERGCGLQKWVG